jgi:hypothetical protein
MFSVLSSFLPAIVWSVLSGVILTAGDVTLRFWFEAKWAHGFEVTFLLYMLGVFFMMMSFFEQNIAIATIAAIVLNAVGYLVAVYFIYGDSITLWQTVGVALGLIALAILEIA